MLCVAGHSGGAGVKHICTHRRGVRHVQSIGLLAAEKRRPTPAIRLAWGREGGQAMFEPEGRIRLPGVASPRATRALVRAWAGRPHSGLCTARVDRHFSATHRDHKLDTFTASTEGRAAAVALQPQGGAGPRPPLLTARSSNRGAARVRQEDLVGAVALQAPARERGTGQTQKVGVAAVVIGGRPGRGADADPVFWEVGAARARFQACDGAVSRRAAPRPHH
jgi:hypothetical protein